jgi:hypothetical protein
MNDDGWTPSKGEFVTWPRNGEDGECVVGCMLEPSPSSERYWGQVGEMVEGDYVAKMTLFRTVPLAPLSKDDATKMLTAFRAAV